jgi:hypothetical protein
MSEDGDEQEKRAGFCAVIKKSVVREANRVDLCHFSFIANLQVDVTKPLATLGFRASWHL